MTWVNSKKTPHQMHLQRTSFQNHRQFQQQIMVMVIMNTIMLGYGSDAVRLAYSITGNDIERQNAEQGVDPVPATDAPSKEQRSPNLTASYQRLALLISHVMMRAQRWLMIANREHQAPCTVSADQKTPLLLDACIENGTMMVCRRTSSYYIGPSCLSSP